MKSPSDTSATTDQQRQVARAVLDPLTDVQRRAVIAVVTEAVLKELGRRALGEKR